MSIKKPYFCNREINRYRSPLVFFNPKTCSRKPYSTTGSILFPSSTLSYPPSSKRKTSKHHFNWWNKFSSESKRRLILGWGHTWAGTGRDSCPQMGQLGQSMGRASSRRWGLCHQECQAGFEMSDVTQEDTCSRREYSPHLLWLITTWTFSQCVTLSLLSHTVVPHKLHWRCITGWISNLHRG